MNPAHQTRVELELKLLTPLMTEGSRSVRPRDGELTSRGLQQCIGAFTGAPNRQDETLQGLGLSDQQKELLRRIRLASASTGMKLELIDCSRNPGYIKHAIEAGLLFMLRSLGVPNDNAHWLKQVREKAAPILGLDSGERCTPSAVRFIRVAWKRDDPRDRPDDVSLTWLRSRYRDFPGTLSVRDRQVLQLSLVVPRPTEPNADIFWIGLLAWLEFLGSARRAVRGFGSFTLMKVAGTAPEWVSSLEPTGAEAPPDRVTRVYGRLSERLRPLFASQSLPASERWTWPRMFVLDAPGNGAWGSASHARRVTHLEFYNALKTYLRRETLGTGYNQGAHSSALSFAPKSGDHGTWAVAICRPSRFLIRQGGTWAEQAPWRDLDDFLLTLSSMRVSEIPLACAGGSGST